MRMSTPPKVTLLGAVIVLVVIAGCISGETDPRPGSGDVGIYFNDGNFSEPGFYLNATVDLSLNVEETVEFDHVMFCLYDSEGIVVNSADIGTFTTPFDREMANVSAETRPQYIIVDHPKFEEYSTIGPVILTWDGESQNFTRIRANDLPFEYPRSDEIGECR